MIFIRENPQENWMRITDSLPQISASESKCTYQSRECLKPKVPLRDLIISSARSSWETPPRWVWISPFSLKLTFLKKWMKLTKLYICIKYFPKIFQLKNEKAVHMTGSTFLTSSKNIYIFTNDWFHGSILPQSLSPEVSWLDKRDRNQTNYRSL